MQIRRRGSVGGGGGCWQTQTLREGRYQLGNRESPDERAVLELYVVSSDLKQNNKNETKRGEPDPASPPRPSSLVL